MNKESVLSFSKELHDVCGALEKEIEETERRLHELTNTRCKFEEISEFIQKTMSGDNRTGY